MENKEESINLKQDWKLINFCEFDKYATKSYCAIHGVDESLNLGDITKVDETKIADFNMMTWGFPCTDISVAGKQKGFLDETGNKTRSGMYYEGIRILKEKNPALSIIENVKNLTGKKFRKEFEMVLSDLDEAGYNSYYEVLNAKNYGIPQNRERVFIVSVRKNLDNGKFKFPKPFDNGIRLKDILEDEVDENFYLPDEKVEQFLENLHINTKRIKEPCAVKDDDASKLLNELKDEVTEPNSVKQLGNIVNSGNWNNPQRGGIYSPNGCSPALNTCGGGGLEPKILQVGKLNSSQDGVVVNPEGIAKTHTAGHNNMPKIICGIDKSINETKTIDNANCITTREDRGISNRKSEGTAILETPDYSYCIDANYYKGTTPEQYVNKHRRQLVFENSHNIQADGVYTNTSPAFTRKPLKDLSRTIKADSHPAGVYDGIRIRKLTPLECFRLMGFSDKDFYAAKEVGISNSQLYKQSGNSIVVDVLYYIYAELYKAMPYLFGDLKLSSFFSGIGAFETALDRLYEGINTGNFTRPQVE